MDNGKEEKESDNPKTRKQGMLMFLASNVSSVPS